MTLRSAFSGLALAGCFALAQTRVSAQVVAAPSVHQSPASSRPHEASLDEYRAHLLSLATLVEACAKARDMKTCDPAQVGPDDEVPLAQSQGSQRRLIRYGWLRVLLSKAQDKDTPTP